ncbi:MAG: FISUMP domain-containing protein [Bacteroidota bacterium]|nr:FISUMP domain-containing protein [Bacteroidota bacterium]
MKTKLLLVSLITGINLMAQSPTCYTAPDGTDGSSWSYKDYIIPTGYRLDSVFMDATRPGYPINNHDFVLESCQGITTYNNTIGTYPFDFNTDNNSEYGIWIDLTSFNYVSVGMVRASLPTNAGAVWNQVCFAISPIISNCGILNDTRDGQQYQTVTIGTQCWMRQNLNYGIQVADVTAMTNNSVVEKACYNNTTSNCSTYGSIYTWDEAMNYGTNQQGICPNGWHIPTKAQFQILINFLGSSTAGQKMKTTSANSPSWDGTNASGFTAISGGIGQGTNYLYMGTRNTYWSSTQFSATDAYDYGLTSGINTLDEAPNTKNSGYCIRCIQDNITTGINSNQIENTISFYPNPTSGVVLIIGVQNETIMVYNSIGQIIKQGNGVNTIDLSSYNSGLYFVQILDEQGTIIMASRILKE